jgi:hypothetical protein
MGAALLMPREVQGRDCFTQPCQRLQHFLRRAVGARNVPHDLPPQPREPFGAIFVAVSRSFKVEGREPHGRGFQLSSSRIIRDSAFRSDVRPYAVAKGRPARTGGRRMTRLPLRSRDCYTPEGSTCANSAPGGIDFDQARSCLNHTPLRGPYSAAKGDIDADSAVLVQHFFGAIEGEFGSVNALPCLGEFQGQDIGRHPASVGFQGVHHEVLTHGGAVRSLTPGGGCAA